MDFNEALRKSIAKRAAAEAAEAKAPKKRRSVSIEVTLFIEVWVREGDEDWRGSVFACGRDDLANELEQREDGEFTFGEFQD